METKNNKNKTIAAVIILVILMIVAVVLYMVFGQKPSPGSKSITLSIVYMDGGRDAYELRTDEEYLLDAANEIDELTIEGHMDGSYFYVDTINGVSADYAADGAYWAIYVDGTYGNYGIKDQPIADGVSYEIRYEVWAQ